MPGVIDNSDIVVSGPDNKDDDPQLLRTLEEGRDYVLVPQEVWGKLSKWYKGGPALPRKMISVGDQQKQFVVEVFPLCLRLIDSRDQSELIIRLSKKASLHDLYVKVCRLKGLQPEKARIWDFFNKQKQTILIASSQTLEESNMDMDQNMTAEYHLPSPVVHTRESCCVIQAMENGFSMVTWIEHVEVDNSSVHNLFRPLVTPGFAFSAQRWVEALERFVLAPIWMTMVLGTPTREEIKCMNPNYTEYKFPQIKAHPWHKADIILLCGDAFLWSNAHGSFGIWMRWPFGVKAGLLSTYLLYFQRNG